MRQSDQSPSVDLYAQAVGAEHVSRLKNGVAPEIRHSDGPAEAQHLKGQVSGCSTIIPKTMMYRGKDYFFQICLASLAPKKPSISSL